MITDLYYSIRRSLLRVQWREQLLYSEAGAMAFGKVYDFGPTFRAEKSKTRRHLTEFWMLEPEMAYYDLNDNMDLIEDFIEYIVQRVVKNREKELKTVERDIGK